MDLDPDSHHIEFNGKVVHGSTQFKDIPGCYGGGDERFDLVRDYPRACVVGGRLIAANCRTEQGRGAGGQTFVVVNSSSSPNTSPLNIG